MTTKPRMGAHSPRSGERDRDLSVGEVAAFWIATEELEWPWRQGLQILLATGCRKSEILESRELDYENGEWLTLTGRRRKTNETLRVAIPGIVKLQIEPDILPSSA